MYEKLNEQIQQSIKPVTEIATINVKALETLAEKQGEFFKYLLESSQSFATTAAPGGDINGVIGAQKAYAEELQKRIATAAEEAYGIITAAQEKSGAILQSVVTDAQAQMAKGGK